MFVFTDCQKGNQYYLPLLIVPIAVIPSNSMIISPFSVILFWQENAENAKSLSLFVIQ